MVVDAYAVTGCVSPLRGRGGPRAVARVTSSSSHGRSASAARLAARGVWRTRRTLQVPTHAVLSHHTADELRPSQGHAAASGASAAAAVRRNRTRNILRRPRAARNGDEDSKCKVLGRRADAGEASAGWLAGCVLGGRRRARACTRGAGFLPQAAPASGLRRCGCRRIAKLRSLYAPLHNRHLSKCAAAELAHCSPTCMRY